MSEEAAFPPKSQKSHGQDGQNNFVGTPCIEGGVHKSKSEEDIPIFGSKVHVHGTLSQPHQVHPIQHHDPHTVINYAKAAKEELFEPFNPGMKVMISESTGVRQYDQAIHHLPSSRHHDEGSHGVASKQTGTAGEGHHQQ